jgi:hypothetical protein
MNLSEQLSEVVDMQRGIVSRRQLLDDGVTIDQIRWSIGRRSQVVLPRVLALFTGQLDSQQRLIAGQLWAGPRAHLAGLTAARWHGFMDLPDDGVVRLLVPWECTARREAFAVRRRTRRMDPHAWQRGPLQVCSPARSLVDAAREIRDANTVRHVLISAIQRRLVRQADLRSELEAGPTRGSAAVRAALNDASTGAWSSPELEVLHEPATSSILPRVWPNPELWTLDGIRLPTPDFWIHEVGIAGQIHSREFHIRDRDWERTVAADSVFAEHGITVVAVTPTGFRRDPRGFRGRVERAFLHAQAAGHRPAVRMTPRGSGVLRMTSA